MMTHRCFDKLDEKTARQWADAATAYAASAVPPPDLAGRGIVICAGGMKYFPPAWVTINVLRHYGCNLPIQVWHLGPGEITPPMRRLLKPLGATPVDGRAMLAAHPHKRLNGWELKCFAMLHCPWREVMFLDADCVPTANPEPLFGERLFTENGSLFWPDQGRTQADRTIWPLTGVPYRDEPEFESGQIFVDKSRCWQPLVLANWFNEESEFWYRHIHGDKDTFRFAWHKLGRPYGMTPHPVLNRHGTMFQHAPDGRVIFQHGTMGKWRYPSRDNLDKKIPLYQNYDLCLGFMQQLDGHLENALASR